MRLLRRIRLLLVSSVRSMARSSGFLPPVRPSLLLLCAYWVRVAR
jgi:hypothetical protein